MTPAPADPLPPAGPGAWAQLLAAALWLPMAACLAWAVQQLADGAGLRAVWPAVLGVVGLGLLRATAEAWGLRRSFLQARQRLSVLRAQVAATVAGNSPLDRDRPASGQVASAIAEQAEAVLPALSRYPPVRLRLLVMPPLLLLAVAWYSWAAAAVLLLAAPLIPLFMAIIGWRAQAASQAQMLEQGQMNGFLLDRLRGLPTLRALGAVEATALRLRATALDLQRRTMAVLRIAFLSSAVLELFSALGVAMVAVYVGFHLLGQLPFGAWGVTLSLGQGLFILMLTPAFFEPLRDLAAVWHDRAAGQAALATLQQLARPGAPLPGVPLPGAVQPVAPETPASPPGEPQALPVQVHELRFGHAGEALLFDGLSFQLRAGEHLALTGPSGSGKSSLLALLAGLAAPQAGRVQLGPWDVHGADAARARSRMGWMGQRPHVFAGSVQANVALGREGLAGDEVARAMHFAVLDDVAQARPGTSLGEGGQGLSGGEAVRLALARLAVHPGAGLLLVDEPTAHLDHQTAAQVMDALLALAQGRTLIVATHDPRLIARLPRRLQLGRHPLREAA